MAKKEEMTQKQLDDVAKALQILFATNFISKKKLYWENFVRGLTFSIGGIIGATVGIAIILGFLSKFETVPFIGPIAHNIQTTIEGAVEDTTSP